MLAAATIVVDAAMLLLHLCNISMCMCKTKKAHNFHRYDFFMYILCFVFVWHGSLDS